MSRLLNAPKLGAYASSPQHLPDPLLWLDSRTQGHMHLTSSGLYHPRSVSQTIPSVMSEGLATHSALDIVLGPPVRHSLFMTLFWPEWTSFLVASAKASTITANGSKRRASVFNHFLYLPATAEHGSPWTSTFFCSTLKSRRHQDHLIPE